MMDDFRNDDPAAMPKAFPGTRIAALRRSPMFSRQRRACRPLGNKERLATVMCNGRPPVPDHPPRMPTGNAAGQMHGFQLWANLPRDQKMCTPRYQDVKSGDIASLTDNDGTHIRVIAGNYRGYRGPVDGIDTDPAYLDITLPANVRKRFPSTRASGLCLCV